MLYEYGFDIVHVVGKESKVIDALSRCSMCNVLIVLRIDLIDEIRNEVTKDLFCCKIIESLLEHPNETHDETFPLYKGNLFYLNHLC